MLTLAACAAAASSIAAGSSIANGAGTREAGETDSLRFRVLLDGKEIGAHRYELTTRGDRRTVRSEAEFEVQFLFFTAFRYRHTLTSHWDGNCLDSLEATTIDNGKKLAVSGRRTDDAFVVDKAEGKGELPSCVMNFAYWEPEILEQNKLLNPQTGEYLEVDVEKLGGGTVDVGGESREAESYRISAKDMRIDVWYAQDDHEWLALESPAKGGRTIRYERT